MAYIRNLKDFWVLSRVVFLESRGEPLDGQEAVAGVVLNRRFHPSDWPNSIKAVCLEPRQFSCFDSGAGGLPAITLRYPWLKNPKDWAIAKDVARRALDLAMVDRVPGANFYRNPRTATSGWFQRQVDSGRFILVRSIGHHDFYRLKGDPEKIRWQKT